jgi:flavodoxin I
MKKIALIFWPEGGNVDESGDKIAARFSDNEIIKVSVIHTTKEILNECNNWIIGGSTVGSHVWEDADDSNKWHAFFKLLDEVDTIGKIVAFYGLGDQVLYPDHFVDGLGVFQEEFEKRNIKTVGQWPAEGYEFTDSEGVKDGTFYGLALDQDSQEGLTDQRIDQWLEIIKKEFN